MLRCTRPHSAVRTVFLSLVPHSALNSLLSTVFPPRGEAYSASSSDSGPSLGPVISYWTGHLSGHLPTFPTPRGRSGRFPKRGQGGGISLNPPNRSFPDAHVGRGAKRSPSDQKNVTKVYVARKAASIPSSVDTQWREYRGQADIVLDSFDGKVPLHDLMTLLVRRPTVYDRALKVHGVGRGVSTRRARQRVTYIGVVLSRVPCFFNG